MEFARGPRWGSELGSRGARAMSCAGIAREWRGLTPGIRGAPERFPRGPQGRRGARAALARGSRGDFMGLCVARVDFAGFRGARRGFLGACASLARGLRRARAGLRGARAGLCGARAGRAGAARGVWEGSSGARARFAYGSRGVRARFRGARARLRLSSFCLCAWLAPSLRRSCTRLALSSRGRRGRGSRWPRAGPQGAARSGRGRARRGGATSLRGAGPDFLCAFLRRYHAVNARAMVWTRLGLHFSTCSALRRCRASRFMRIALAALPRASGATDLARARP